MYDNLAQTAINLALECKWDEAVAINNKILKSDNTDIDALNRLAKALYELGDYKKAKLTTQKALKLDRTNKIAIKALERYKHKPRNQSSHSTDSDFLEEVGKTKLTTLINLGSEKIYSYLGPGEEVLVITHAHKVSVTTMGKKYIGRITDDLASRLRKLIKGGNKYKALVKSVDKNSVKIFIKETKKSKEFQGIQSFSRDQADLESSGEFSS